MRKNWMTYFSKRLAVAVVSVLGIYQPGQAQLNYVFKDERKATKMGVERVARLFTAVYESKLIKKEGEIRWVQLDLGAKKKIDGIKLLPRLTGYGDARSQGFPARFTIEVSDDPEFKTSVMYFNQSRSDFPDPFDQVCTFSGREAQGRYVRLTGLTLRQQFLALTKFMVLSDGKDIAEGCTASDSESGNLGVMALTRPARPQGEGVVTDNPGNIIPQNEWNPVSYKAQAPKGGVRLGEGLFKKALEDNAEYLMSSFTLEDQVRNFYLKAGKPVKPFNEKLHKFWFLDLPGQEAARFLMGAGNTLRWMENPEMRKRMDQIVDVIDECKEPDGYLMAYPKDRIFAVENGAYVRSWVTHGLIEAGYAGNQKAFPLLRNFYDWFNQSVYLPEMLRRTGQGTQGIIPSTRMYFTPVGKPKDIEVVQQYFQENYWMEQMSKREEKAIWLYPYDRPHNYLLTGIEPYLDLYRATGAKKYLDAASGGWDLYHDSWEHVGGSIAICEGTFLYAPKSYHLHKSTGELCGSVFWSLLNQRFHLLNPGEEKYVSEIEKSIYNVLIASQVGDKGIRYHAVLDEHKDLDKVQPHAQSTCCEGQGTRMLGALPEFIYSVAEDGVYVDLFAASTIDFTTRSGRMSLKMDTQFPYDPKVQLTVSTDKPGQSKIRIRIPSWASKNIAVRVNDKVMTTGKPGSYLTLDRQWKNGDVISFTLPMEFKMSRYTGAEREADHERYALEYGPILLASVSLKEGKDKLVVPLTADKLIKNLKPVAGKPLHFIINGSNDFEYMPYFEVQEERFSCYPYTL